MAFGLCFQLPVLLTLMGKAGLVSAEGLGNVRQITLMVGHSGAGGPCDPPGCHHPRDSVHVVVYGLYESVDLSWWPESRRPARPSCAQKGFYD